MDYRAKFLKIYANLPSAAREEIVVVIDSEPYTWNAAKIEVEQDTLIGKKILGVLERLKILV